jgi:transcriptional regulator with GAF, ATPase, and Fis domain
MLETLRDPLSIALSNAVRYRKLVELKNSLDEDNRFLRREIMQTSRADIVGAEGGLSEVMDILRQVAPQSCPVLLLGETGTGKELLARAVHRLSPRRDGPFVACNCGAIPANLVDSELFGHEKGAFTGADSSRPGRFERAHQGTIFLDEIGELKPEAQVRLLRVLQEKEVERVGGRGTIPVDIRVVAATHRDLHTMCRKNEFREDLLFRLSVVPVRIPPLRERLRDIGPLVQHFLLHKARDLGISRVPGLAEDALTRLERYGWPGNVRELENAVERALILSRDEPLAFEDLGRATTKPSATAKTVYPPAEEGPLPTMDQAAAALTRQALSRSGGRVGGPCGAAAMLGVNPSTLRKRMRRLGVPFGRKVVY